MNLKLLILSLLITTTAFSQERKIIGRILNADTRKPIKNVNIIIRGTTSGTISNHLGFFELAVDASKYKTLIVSHIGFKTSEVPIPPEDRFQFVLEKEYTLLNKLDLAVYPRKTINEEPPKEFSTKSDNGFIVIESNAGFPNGMINFYDFMGNSLVSQLSHIGERGFTINFTINENGQAIEISTSDSTEIVKNVVLKAFKEMPAWIPATQRENNTSQHFILPINRVTPSSDLKAFNDFISRNIKYPAQARRMGVEGAVYVEFRIDQAGEVVSILLLKDIGAECGEEVRRVIASTPTEYTKALFEKTKSDKFVLPVLFGLGKPFKVDRHKFGSNALLLSEVEVTAIGVGREKSVIGYPAGKPQSTSIGINPSSFNPVKTFYSLNSALEKPKTVRRLSMVNNSMNSFPTDILKLENLEFLDLEKNQIRTLPGEIQALSKLEELYLFENQIDALPSSFGNLKKLKALGLASNQFKSFPLEICSLDKLEALDLSYNRLTSIPSEISTMKNLKFLFLHGNRITNLPKEFYGLKNLERIYLQGNPIDATDIKLLKAAFKKTEIVLE